MNASIETVLNEFHQRAEREHDVIESLSREEFGKRLDEFLLPVGPETGKFLNILIKAGGARSILEIGTSHGYSTIWMADAARETDGMVVSLDLHAAKQEYARKALARCGLADRVQFITGDCRETLKDLPGPFDFVLLDIWKRLYVPALELVYPKLNPGAILVADNVTYPESAQDAVRAYQERVRSLPRMESVMVPIGNGVELSRYAG
jgi:predicted O-methyltransferase YrrM